MDEAFACPECGTTVEVRGLAPGRQVRCGFCKRLLEVPYIRRVESSGWKRRRFGRPWWVVWAWAGIGVMAGLVALAGAVRYVWDRQGAAEVRSIQALVASAAEHEEKGELGQALIELDTAIELSLRSQNISSDQVRDYQLQRRKLARSDAQAIVERLETTGPNAFPLGDWLNVLARISADPDLNEAARSSRDRFTRRLQVHLEAELAKARRSLEAGARVSAFDTCDATTKLLSHLPDDARAVVQKALDDLVRRIVGENGIIVDPIRGKLLAGSLEKYTATMIPELVRGLRAKEYVPLLEGSPWREHIPTIPYRLAVELNEKLEGNYMATENRLTRIDAHLILSRNNREIWQTTPTARTTVPLPNLPAYQSARMALNRERSAALEELLYNNARSQIDGKFAFAVQNMPRCGQ